MELSIEAQETHLRSLRDWLEDEDRLRPLAVRWVSREARPDEMGVPADVLMVALGSGGAGTVLAGSIAVWIRYRSSDLTLKITGRDGAVVEIDAQRVDDPVEIIRLITSLFPPA